MPFRRTHVRHRLHDAIFRLQSAAKPGGEIPHLAKSLDQARERVSISSNVANRSGDDDYAGLAQDSSSFPFFDARLQHLIVRRFFNPVIDQLFAEILVFSIRGAQRVVTGISSDNVPFFHDLRSSRVFFRRRLRQSAPSNSRCACCQSPSVNSSGSRSSIIAISRARCFTMSGEGAPSPFPCSVIFPERGCEYSFIISNSK